MAIFEEQKWIVVKSKEGIDVGAGDAFYTRARRVPARARPRDTLHST